MAMLLLMLACKAPDPAPTEVEGLAHYMLVAYGDDDPAPLVEAADNLAAWYRANVGEGDLGGSLEDVSREALDALGMPAETDPAEVMGIFHLTPQACSLEDLAALYLFPQQDQLFPDSYNSYRREFDGDTACFLPGDCERADWTAHIESTLVLDIDMAYRLRSGVRRVDLDDRWLLYSRTHLPEPAEVDSFAYFDQSYQIEALLPWDDGTSLHLYALWNAGGADGLDPEADFWRDQYLDGVVDWNTRIDEVCADPSLFR